MKVLNDGSSLHDWMEMVSFAVSKPERETQKAYGFMDNHGDLVWIPKSMCKLIDMENGSYDLTVSQRTYDEKELDEVL